MARRISCRSKHCWKASVESCFNFSKTYLSAFSSDSICCWWIGELRVSNKFGINYCVCFASGGFCYRGGFSSGIVSNDIFICEFLCCCLSTGWELHLRLVCIVTYLDCRSLFDTFRFNYFGFVGNDGDKIKLECWDLFLSFCNCSIICSYSSNNFDKSDRISKWAGGSLFSWSYLRGLEPVGGFLIVGNIFKKIIFNFSSML